MEGQKKDDDKKVVPPAAAVGKQPAASSQSQNTEENANSSAQPTPGTQIANNLQTLLKRVGKNKGSENTKHDFWAKQPVPQFDDDLSNAENNWIEAPKDPKDPKDVRQTPYELNAMCEWSETDLNDDATIKEVYDLLTNHYVEDDDNMFRFDYSIEFLRWALTPPGYLKQWHVGVRLVSNKKLVAFISGIPARIRVHDKEVNMVEINFLCVHQKLRSKRLAPLLISEITRRVNLTNTWQAVYTAGIVIPKPVSVARYWHRSLNPKKLIEVGFSHLGQRMTLQRTIKLYKLPNAPLLPGIRPLVAADIPKAFELVNTTLKKYKLAPVFHQDEFGHFVTPKKDVVYSYVVENPETKEITDFLSFYCLPSSVLKHPVHKTLKAAYSFYNAATTVSYKDLMNDALILASLEGFDVFNCLNIMENETFLKDLKFGIGDGNLQYYLYNWRCPPMEANQLGLVLM